MPQQHKIISFVIGFGYVAMLWQLSLPQPVFRVLLPVFLLFCLAAAYYNRRYLRSIEKYNVWVLLRSILLLLSGLAIFFLLPTPAFRNLFLLSAFFMVSFVELNLGNFSENLLVNETLLVGFGLFVGLSAAAQYFPDFQRLSLHLGKWHLLDWQFSLQPLYLLGVFVAALFLARAFYEFIPQGSRTKWVAGLAIGLFCSELFWAESFLPFHYSVLALILFCLFYFCLILNYYYLFHSLTLKKIQFHLLLVGLAIALVILATPWKILA